jgi:hypothetical protein
MIDIYEFCKHESAIVIKKVNNAKDGINLLNDDFNDNVDDDGWKGWAKSFIRWAQQETFYQDEELLLDIWLHPFYHQLHVPT